MQHNFLPVIVGTDINAYNMSISFHEEYGIHPVLVGKEPMGFTSMSTIPQAIEYDSALWDKGAFVSILGRVAKKYKKEGRQLLLIGTNDFYVRLIIENQEKLSEWYVFNYISEDLMNNLLVKKNFYRLCDEHGLDTPDTYFYSCREQGRFNTDIRYPAIVKPSNGVEYYKNKFDGQQKVYRVETPDELLAVIDKVNASGYKDDLIIQDFIPGDDTYMWDSVFYVNSKGKAELGTLAQVVLQEHTVTAIGNYTALVTRYDEALMQKLQRFLEAVGYRGFANFDLKYDVRDGKFKVFEVNIRQGRSSYYTTANGHNMARYLVDDVIRGKEKELTYLNTEFLFTVVPKIVLKTFVDNQEINREVRRLLREGKWGNPLFYKGDKHRKRPFFMLARQINYYRKYKNNQW
ncbi:carbamoyl phosphate synthase-like protein [Bhargavaea cecembensis DSE10]|uniref:Carbamoyl phosphate synthase-like protein n=1 Tax=Bhargavaea cecembensis DSE10 TaxID=1235279 RepID=M7NUF6_9BACL|nr:carbamoyl phosphate synthase-like protein [Bhargavaea cecembensis]EMR05270.1 carbamoyl phosphate synthase-like protein [Bhargavaea cecembensis DSE10]